MALHAFVPLLSTLAQLDAAAELGMDTSAARSRVAHASRDGKIGFDMHLSVLVEIIEATGRRELPAQVAVDRPAAKYGVYGFLGITQPDMCHGLQASSRHLSFWMQGVSFLPSVTDVGLQIRIQQDDGVARPGSLPAHLVDEVSLASLVGAARFLTGKPDWRPVSLTALGDSVEVLGSIVGPDRVAEGWPTLYLDAASCRLPCTHAHPEMAAYFERVVREATAKTAEDDALLRGVREAVAKGLPRGQGALETIAPDLGMSPRTLQRRLAEAGSSFLHLREDVQRSIALRLLQQPEVTVASVAAVTGFDNEGALRRAFRRWTGLAPSEWREHTDEEGAPLARED